MIIYIVFLALIPPSQQPSDLLFKFLSSFCPLKSWRDRRASQLGLVIGPIDDTDNWSSLQLNTLLSCQFT